MFTGGAVETVVISSAPPATSDKGGSETVSPTVSTMSVRARGR